MTGRTPKEFTTPFARYTATRQLGEGGSGRVFAATSDDGQAVAVKLLDPTKATRDKQRRFKNEIFFGLSARHPHIAPVTEYGVVDVAGTESPFYIMPLYASTLRERMQKGLDANAALRYFGHVLDGVEAAHLMQVWHRDLKPENVLIASDGDRAVVADFGIARFAPALQETAVVTQPRARLANFIYAAPEQRSGGEVDHRADIYALGLMLHELLTGTVPHGTAYEPIAVKAAQLSYLDELVARMLSNRPSDRPASVDDIKKELIKRRNDFVSRQKVDLLRRTVVPTTAVTDRDAIEPIRVTGGEWLNEQLHFHLSHAPSPRWQELCRTVQGVSEYLNYPASRIRFEGATAMWQAPEHLAQAMIAQFKDRVERTNQECRRIAEAEALAREEAERRRLREEGELEERRRRVNANLQF